MPCVGVAAILHRRVRVQLKQSLASLIGNAQENLRIDLSSLKSSIESLRAEKRFSPNLYTHHWALSQALQKGDIYGLRDALEALIILNSDSAYGPPFSVGTIGREVSDTAVVEDVIGPDAPRGQDGTEPEVLPLDPETLRRIREPIAEAIGVISKCDAGIFDEFSEYVSSLKVFTGKIIRGVTSVRAYGAVYIRIPERFVVGDESVAYFVEHIVHETSHLHLHALMVSDPLVRNTDEQLFQAPIRHDPRPMYGIFHATFVLSRMIRVFDAWSESQKNPDVEKRASDFRKRFQSGLRTVAEHGILTDAGRSVFNSLPVTAGDPKCL